MFSKSFPWGVHHELLKIPIASKLTFRQQRDISSSFPVVIHLPPLSKIKRIFNIHALGTSLDTYWSVKQNRNSPRACQAEGTRREVDSQVNISLYLKKPEYILKLLLIFMPTPHRLRQTQAGLGRAGNVCLGHSSWLTGMVTLSAKLWKPISSIPEPRFFFLVSFPPPVGSFRSTHPSIVWAAACTFHTGRGSKGKLLSPPFPLWTPSPWALFPASPHLTPTSVSAEQ